MADIFISYAKEDKPRIQPLVPILESNGWSVFWDQRIPAGQTWRSYIGKALIESRSIIVVWSRHSLQSDWVSEEADVGKSRNILVPILLDEVLPPMGFRSIQAANLITWDGDRNYPILVQLLTDLQTLLGKRRQKSSPTQIEREVPDIGKTNGKTRGKKNLLLYAGLVILSILIGGIYYNGRINDKRKTTVVEEVSAMPVEINEGNRDPINNINRSSIRYYIGQWTNIDPNTRGITKLSLRKSGEQVYIHVWGSCSPNDCDWGEVVTEVFTTSVSANTSSDVRSLKAEYKPGFKITILNIKPEGNDQIKVETSTKFTDNSGRASVAAEYYFKKRY